MSENRDGIDQGAGGPASAGGQEPYQVDGLSSLDESVRVRTVVKLGKTEAPEVIPPLEQAADADHNPRVRYIARKQVEEIRKRAESGPPPLDVKAPNRVRGAGSIDLERFARGMGAKDKRVRINAVKVAMASRDPRVVDILVKHAKSEPDDEVLAALLQAVGLLGGKHAIPFIIEYLTGKSSVKVKVASVTALGLVHKVVVYPYIVKALTLREPAVARAAYRELKKLGKANLINLLRNMLYARQQWMAKAAVKACRILGRSSRSIVRLLEERRPKAPPELKKRIEKALAAIAGKDDASVLSPGDSLVASIPGFDLGEANLSAVQSRSMSAADKLKAIQTFVDNKDTSKVPLIVKWLESEEDLKTRATLIIAVGRLGAADQVDKLARYLDATDGRVRANAVEALGMIFERYGDSRIPALLEPLLADRHNRVKANAVVALKGEGPAAEALEQMVYSGSPTYQRSAIYAIMVLKRSAYKPLLEFLSRAKDRMVQKQAAEALEFFIDSDAVPELSVNRELTISENEEVVRSGVEADEELAGVVVNPWDSVLMSTEEARSVIRKRRKSGKDGTGNGQETSAATDLVDALASTVVLVMSAAFYVLCVAILVFLVLYILEFDFAGISAVFWTLAVVLLVAALDGLTPKPVDGPINGQRITRRDAPKLFSAIEKAADQLRVAKPETVLIHPHSEIGLYYVSGTPFIPWSSGPQLRLGLASLRALTVDQLRAAIYGEFARESLAGRQFYMRVVTGFDGALQQIHEKLFVAGDARVFVNPLYWAAFVCRRVLHLLSGSAYRRMVLQADRLAARYVGRDVYSAALNKYSISARLFDRDLAEIVYSASKHGQSATENIYAYYRSFLDGLDEKRLKRLKKEIFKYSPPGDRLFPPLQARLDVVSSVPDSADRPDSAQAAGLLVNQARIERDFSVRFVELIVPPINKPVGDGKGKSGDGPEGAKPE